MTHIKNILFVSLIGSLIIFINCNEDDNSTVDNTMNEGSTDPINYTLTMNTSEGGAVTPGSGTYSENDSLELLGIPDSTYAFVNWTGSVLSTDNPLSVTMDADKSITGNFAKKQYPLTIIIEGEGAVSEEIVTNGRVEDYDEGTRVKLTATAAEGWKFKEWKELEVDTNTLIITISEGKTLTAQFTKTYTLTITATEGGIVTPESGTYNETDSIELFATPDSTFSFINWIGSISGTENPLIFTMDADKSIAAVFAKTQYNLNINVDGEGTVSEEIISNGRGDDYDVGTLVRLTANPSNGWDFVKWTGDFVSHKSEIEISIDQDISLTAEFTNLQNDFQYERSMLLDGLGIIWGIEMLDSNRLIFTEKTGSIYLLDQAGVHRVEGFPLDEINSSSQGGLLDIKRHPNYFNNGWIYLCYSKKEQTSDNSKLTLVRFQLNSNNIENIESLFETSTVSSGNNHLGSRISFDQEYLYLSIGEGSPSLGGPTTLYNNAQNLNNDWGKIHRIFDDGMTPQSNPIFDENSPTSLFSIGHRNPQGLTYNPYLNEMYSSEHGPQGGDEINIIKSGLNYGWPNVSFGINYDGSDISGQSHEGYEQPVFYWDPSIATSDLIFLKDKRHGSWFKNLLVAGMATKGIHRLKMMDDQTVEELEFIPVGERVRDICEGLNGIFYISTDVGQIYQFTPK